MNSEQPGLPFGSPGESLSAVAPQGGPADARDTSECALKHVSTARVAPFPCNVPATPGGRLQVANEPKSTRGARKTKQNRPFANTVVASRERLLRRPEVEHLTGLSRSSLYRLIEAKQFPPSIKLSKSAAAWPLSAIETWIAARIEQAQKSSDDRKGV